MAYLIADRRIATKIAASFTAILLITAAVGAVGLRSTALLESRMDSAADITATMSELQSLSADVQAYAVGGSPAVANRIDAGIGQLLDRLGSDGDSPTLAAAVTALEETRGHLVEARQRRAAAVEALTRMENSVRRIEAGGLGLEDAATKEVRQVGNLEASAKQTIRDATRLLLALREIDRLADAIDAQFAGPASAADNDVLAAADIGRTLRKAKGTVPPDAPHGLDAVQAGFEALKSAAAEAAAGGNRFVVATMADRVRQLTGPLVDIAAARLGEGSTAMTDVGARMVAADGISAGAMKYAAAARAVALDFVGFTRDIRKPAADSLRAGIDALMSVSGILSTDGAAIPQVAGFDATMKPVYEGLRTDVQVLRDADGWFIAHISDMRSRIGRALAAMNTSVSEAQAGAMADRQAALWAILAALAAAVVLASAVGVLLTMVIRRPIRDLTQAMQTLASGNVDIALKGESRRDEIGEMTRAVRVFRDGAIERMRLEDEARADQDARARRNERIEALIAAFDDRAGRLLAAASASGDQLGRAAGSLEAIANRSASLADSATGATSQTSENVATVASAAEELSASIEEIGRQVARTQSVVTGAVDRARGTSDQMKGLSEMANRIGDVVGLIRAVADQTNLLALNATIEAARAGEAGKGFAVVAGEVKALARQTADATEEIARQIHAIQTATGQSVQAIGEIAGTIDAIGNQTTGIAAAVEEQGAATGEISSNIQRVAGAARSVDEDMGELGRAVDQTTDVSSTVRTAAEDMDRAARELSDAIRGFLGDVRAA